MGVQNVFYCGEHETIQHIFIECPLAKFLWCTVYFTYDLPPPTNITNMFGNWLNGVDRQSKAFIRIGVSALCWSIWRVRNDIFFNKKISFHFLQVINMVSHWVQLWALLSPEGLRDAMASRCTRLLMVTQDILCQAG